MVGKEVKAGPLPERSKHVGTWIALLSVLLSFAVFFHKSVFLGRHLTRLGVLPHIDALYNPGLKQAVIDIGRDPTGYLMFFPNGHFVDSMWWHLVPPLWNPLIACGYPLLGDPQTYIHSPAHLLQLFSSPEAYQIGLLLEIALGGIGMVLLSRFYALSCPASILAALAFVLSPRVIAPVDLNCNECCIPFLFLGFGWLAQKPSLARAVLAGLLCAICAYTTHPEPCFFTVLLAAILCFFSMTLAGFGKQAGLKECLKLVVSDGIKSFALLLVTAAVSLILAAPLIFPFLEFLRNAYIYKDASGFVAPVSLPEFLGGFYASHGQAPFFLGSIAALLVPIGLTGKNRFVGAFFLTLVVGFLLCVPPGLIVQVLSQKPISYLATSYGIPALLLIMSLLAGIGLDLVFERLSAVRVAVLLLSAAVVFYYPIDHLQHVVGGQDFNLIWRSGKTLLTATSIFGISACCICLISGLAQIVASLRCSGLFEPLRGLNRLPAFLKIVGAFGLVALNFASLALVDRDSLPVNSKFSLKPPPPVAFLQAVSERSLATGPNFFLPNTNLDYGIRDFRCFNPLLPLRYKRFLQEAGGSCHNLYFYDMPDRCSRLLDLASVKYVLTRSALRAANERSTDTIDLGEPRVKRFIPGLRILQARLSFDPVNSQIDADMKLRVHDLCNNRVALQYCIVDADGSEVWSSREMVLSPADGPLHTSNVYESWPVPRSVRFPVSVGLRVKDTWGSQFICPEAGMPHTANAFLLCTVDRSAPAGTRKEESDFGSKVDFQKTDSLPVQTPRVSPVLSRRAKPYRHYRLVAEFPQEGCRIYRNECSLPSAYLINNVRHFKPGDDMSVWKRLKDESFDANSELLVEDGQKGFTEESSPSLCQAISIQRPDCNTVATNFLATSDSWLVLTDSYYPGWECFVDGRQTHIFPANYLFRAVKVARGHHSVKFCFLPTSYYSALALCLLGGVAVCAFGFKRRKE